MRKFTFLLLLFIGLKVSLYAQLSPGDIAVIGINTDNEDAFGFVALVDIPASTIINFTDNGVFSDGTLRTGEGTLAWSHTSVVAKGTVVTWENPTWSVGSSTGSNPAFSGSGDQCIVYTGSSASPNYIFALNIANSGWITTGDPSSNTSYIPTGLAEGTDAINVGSDDNGYYSGSTSGSQSALLSLICDNSNWITNNTRIDISSWPVSFSITGGGNLPPVISNISNIPENPTATETVSVSADVTDDVAVVSVNCKWGTTDGGPYPSTISMSLDAGDTYVTDTDIPAQAEGTTVFYIIEATDGEPETTTSPQQSYTIPVSGLNAWINEFHYDNDGTDAGEFVEVVIENAGTFTLSDFQVDLYNGNNGASYNSKSLDVFTEGDIEGNFTFYTYVYPVDGIQNGAPDGIALSYQGTLIAGQFLSYEGSFTATDGPANGVTSTDIGVSETGTTPIGYSLQLKGGGDEYAMFFWVQPAPETPGAMNNNQFFGSNYTTWNGNINDDWTDAANWNNGAPDATLNVIVPAGVVNYPTLSAPGSCNDLFMESNASLVGVDNLTLSGTATIERTIDAYTSDNDGYHFLSAPVSGFDIAGSDFEPTENIDDFFSWDEPSNTWLNWYEGMGETGNFEVGIGYLVAYDPTNPGTFTGSLNTVQQIKSLSYTPTQGDGWNLLGNPYPSAIDWDLLTKTSVDGSVYVLDGSDNSYLSWNGSVGDLTDGIIPINNGFFVKTGSAGNNFTIVPSAQVHSSQGFLKSADESEVENTLKVLISNETYEKATFIQFSSNATNEFDSEIDAYKLFGSSDAPQLFTSLGGIEYSINCLPFSSEVNQLPFGFKNRQASEYTISISGIESFVDDNIEIYLEDTETSDLIDLTLENYTFSAQEINYDDRFILHFSGITDVEEQITAENIQIYTNENSVYLKFESMPGFNAQVSVFNTIGQKVYAGMIGQSTLSKIPLNEKPGIYIVRLQSEKGTTTQKVMIK